LRDMPDQSFDVKLGPKTLKVSLKDIIYDATKGDFKHPNTMTCKLLAGDKVLLEQEYYSVGGGFIEWKGYTPPKKNAPKYPFATMKELRQHAEQNKLSIAQVILANETSISGKSDAEVYAFVDKITGAMVAALIASAHDASPRVTENAAESALEHHLGMTCDPVAGYVQIPCIERCAFGAVKAWTAYAIASNEIASSHRVGLDETITAMAQ